MSSDREMDFLVREAHREDYEQLDGLFADLDVVHRQALPAIFQEAGRPARSKKYIFDIITNENAALFIAECNGQIVGFIQLLIKETPNIPIMVPRRYVVIDDLLVKENFRRFGVAKSLVTRVHEWALANDISQVELNVWEFNKIAVTFYEKIGYHIQKLK